MTFEKDGAHYIRGIVSVGAADEEGNTDHALCDSTHYAVFTDVAKYLPWIEEVANIGEQCEINVECTKIHS